MKNKSNFNKYQKAGYIKYFFAQFLFIYIPFIIGIFHGFDKFYILFGIFFLVFLISFISKNQNEVYEIVFDEIERVVYIKQFQFLLKNEIKVKYENYSTEYKKAVFGLGSIMNALIIKDKGRIVTKIGVRNWFDWTEEDLKYINNYFQEKAMTEAETLAVTNAIANAGFRVR